MRISSQMLLAVRIVEVLGKEWIKAFLNLVPFPRHEGIPREKTGKVYPVDSRCYPYVMTRTCPLIRDLTRVELSFEVRTVSLKIKSPVVSLTAGCDIFHLNTTRHLVRRKEVV